MPVKIKGTANLGRKLKKLLPDARSSFAKEMKAEIVDIIVEKITSGLSPVKGQNRYTKYSEKYGKYKGRRQPVDLVDSGKMLNDMKAVQKNNGNIEIKFNSKESDKLASYHQKGKGSLPVRKILPSKRTERFKSDILKKIIKAAQKAVRESIKNFTKR